MSRFVETYTAELAGQDVFVFFKTPWVERVYDETTHRKEWKRTDENYVYALRPHRMVHGSKVAAEAYTIWAGRLQMIWNSVLDSITQDEPLNLADEEEGDEPKVLQEKSEDYAAYDALVMAMAKEGVLGKDSVIVEDGKSWQKDKATQKWRKELKELQNATIDDDTDAPMKVA